MAKGDADRTPESEIAIGALRIMIDHDGEAMVTTIKEEIPDYVELTAADKTKSQTRPGEALYAQIVGNIVSHRESEGNIICEGYAIYNKSKGSLSITDAGRAYLKRKGY